MAYGMPHIVQDLDTGWRKKDIFFACFESQDKLYYVLDNHAANYHLQNIHHIYKLRLPRYASEHLISNSVYNNHD